jgi:hypothetical protein
MQTLILTLILKMKRSVSETSSKSEESNNTKKSKLIFVNESDTMPQVGIHHGGSFDVYMNHKVAKLREVHKGEEIVRQSTIFESCIIYVNGITNPPVEEIRRMVTLHGGEVVNYRVSEVTHFVCDYFTDAQLKVELARQKLNTVRTKVYNVTATWVTESIKQNARQMETNFIPKGLKIRTGVTLTDLMTKITPKKKEDALNVVTIEDDSPSSSIAAIATPSPLSVPGLSSSQEHFIRSIPKEFRDDAVAQLRKETVKNEDQQLRQPKEVIELFTQPDNKSVLKREKEESNEEVPNRFDDREFKDQITTLLSHLFASEPEEIRRTSASTQIKLKIRRFLRTKLNEMISFCYETTTSSSSSDRKLDNISDVLTYLGLWFIEHDQLEYAQLMISFFFTFLQENDELGKMINLPAIIRRLQFHAEKKFGHYLSVD